MSGSGYIYDYGLLDDLSRSDNALLRLEAALNRHTRPDTLIELIGDRDEGVRAAATGRIVDHRLQRTLTAEQSARLAEHLLVLLAEYHRIKEQLRLLRGEPPDGDEDSSTDD